MRFSKKCIGLSVLGAGGLVVCTVNWVVPDRHTLVQSEAQSAVDVGKMSKDKNLADKQRKRLRSPGQYHALQAAWEALDRTRHEGISGPDYEKFRSVLDQASPKDIAALISYLNESSNGDSFALKAAGIAMSALVKKDAFMGLDMLKSGKLANSIVEFAAQYAGISAKNDDAGLKRWIDKELSDNDKNSRLLALAIKAYASNNTEGALNLLKARSDSFDAASIKSLCTSLGEVSNSPSLGLSQLGQFLSGEVLDNARNSFLNGIAIRNPELLFNLLQSDKSITASGHTMTLAFSALAETKPDVAAKQLEELDVSVLGDVLKYPGSLDLIYKGNPELLIKAVGRLPLSSANESIIDNAAKMIASQDPKRAIAWISEYPPSQVRDRMSVDLYAKWATSSPELMKSVIQEVPEANRQNAINGIAIAIGKADIAKYVDFSESLNSNEMTRFFARATTSSMEVTDSASISKVVQCLSQALNSGILQENNHELSQAIEATAQIYSNKNGVDEIEWIDNLPAGYRSAAYAGLMKNYISRDIFKASSWLTSLPESDSKRAAARVLLAELDRVDPDSAKQWRSYLGRQ